MRGNPVVELIAILVMLASVLVGGAYWGAYKYNKPEKVLQLPEKVSPMKVTFEKAVKETKE
jgi:hypothetical protein